MKKIYLILSTLLLIITPMSIIKISNEEYLNNFNINKKEDTPIGKITINKINLNEYFYSIESTENTIEKHVSILKESDFPNILILAAHSGIGKIAYFEKLDHLNINDEIKINYDGKVYYYIIKEIWEEKKNGYININKELEHQLILTTCSPKKKNYQLVINCIEKES